MSFAGKQFFDKAYKEAHKELHFQHRGKGRYYIVDKEAATVPPPVQALRKFKAEKKSTSTVKTEDAVPKEPKPARKRRADNDLDEQPVLKATRTRNGSARTNAIDVDAEASKEPGDPNGATNQDQEQATTADSDILIAPAKSPPKTTAKGKAKPKAKAAPPKKQPTRTPAKPCPARTTANLYKLKAPTTKNMLQERLGQAAMDDDFDRMGLSSLSLFSSNTSPPHPHIVFRRNQ